MVTSSAQPKTLRSGELLFQRVVTAQLGHARPIDHAGNGLDLFSPLSQFQTLLKLLGENSWIGMTEPAREGAPWAFLQ